MKKKRVLFFALCLLILVLGSISAHAKTKTPKVQKKTMYVGETCKLKVKCQKKAKWTSTKKSVAKVSKKGVVKARKPGRCTIKAVVNNRTYRFRITVKNRTNAEITPSHVNSPSVADGSTPLMSVDPATAYIVENESDTYNPYTVELDGDADGTVKVVVEYYSPYFLKGIRADGKIYSSLLIGPSTIRTKFAKDPWVDSYQAFVYFSGMKFGKLDVYDDAVWGSAEFAWELYNSNNRCVKRGVYSTGRQHYIVPVKGEIVISFLEKGNYTFRMFNYRKSN